MFLRHCLCSLLTRLEHFCNVVSKTNVHIDYPCLSVCPSLALRVSVCLSISVCRCVFVSVSVPVAICLSLCFCLCLFVFLSVRLCLSLSLSVCLSPLRSYSDTIFILTTFVMLLVILTLIIVSTWFLFWLSSLLPFKSFAGVGLFLEGF